MKLYPSLIAFCCMLFFNCSTSGESADTLKPSDFSATGTLVVINKSGNTASLIDLSDGKEAAIIETGTGPHEVAVSPDGKKAVVTNYGASIPGSSLTIIDIPGKMFLKNINLGTFRRPHGIEYLPGGDKVLVTAEDNQALLIVNVNTGEVEESINTNQEVSHMVAHVQQKALAFVANMGSGSVSIIDLNDAKLVKNIKTGAGAEGIAVTPDGTEVWVTNRGANTVTILDAESLNIISTLKSEDFPIRVKITPDGRYSLVSNARSGNVNIFEVKTRKLVQTIPMEITGDELKDGGLLGGDFAGSPVPIGILIGPKSRYAYIANTNADIVTVIDLGSFEIVGRLKTGDEPDGLGFSPIVLQ